MLFDEALRAGKIGEGLIARWFRRRGFNVLPVYEKEIQAGKGPTLFTAIPGDGALARALISPDMLVFNATSASWIEAKTKSAFTWYRVGECWQTGINLAHYEDYLKIIPLAPFPLHLVFLHLEGQAKDTPEGLTSPTGLFWKKLDYLKDCVDHISMNHGASGMVYWNITDLEKIADLEEVLSEPVHSVAELNNRTRRAAAEPTS